MALLSARHAQAAAAAALRNLALDAPLRTAIAAAGPCSDSVVAAWRCSASCSASMAGEQGEQGNPCRQPGRCERMWGGVNGGRTAATELISE